MLVWTSFAGLLSAHAAAGLDPATALTQYGHTAWRIREGHFAGHPSSIAQTTDGFLWIGTSSGLLRFDGVRFTPWQPPAGSPLPDDRIVNILGASDGSLWIGTADGLARWHGGRLTVHARAGRFGALVEDRQGTVWAGHTRAVTEVPPLCRFRRGAFRCFGFPEEHRLGYVGALHEDRQGRLWIGGPVGVCRWRPQGPVCYEIGALATLVNRSGVFFLADDAEGNLWATTGAEGFWRLAGGVWTAEPGLTSGPLLADRSRTLWLGTADDGLVRRAAGRTEHFSQADGLSGDQVHTIFEDREGNLWVATSGGLDRFRDVKVATLTLREGLPAEDVGAVAAARDGGVWIAERNALLHWRDGAVSVYRAEQGLPGKATSLLADSRGRLWVGVDNGLAWWERGRFSSLALPDGSAVGLVYTMAEDRDGSIWAAAVHADHALLRIRGERVVESVPLERLGGLQIAALAAHPEGGVWLGLTNAELRLYRGGRVEPAGKLAGPEGARLHGLLPGAQGLWLMTSRGLGLLRNGALRTLDARRGLPCDHVEDAVQGGDGSLWVKTICGLVRIPAAELAAWTADPGRRVRVRVLDAFDGARAGVPSFTPRSARSLDGRLWLTTEGAGLQVVDPARLKDNPVPPPVQILRVVADGTTHEPGARLRLPPLTRDLEIDFTALSLTVPEKVRFRYRLLGAGDHWHDAGTRREAYFNNLKPGSYRFHVVASNNDGVWNQQGAALDFVLLPAFYQTRTFMALSLAALALLAWAAYRWRLRQVAARLDLQFQERLAERTRIAQDLHDTLLQGLLSASLQLHVVADELPADAPETPRLRRVQQLMARVIDEGRNAVRGLRTPAQKLAGGDDLAEALARVPQDLGLDGAAELRVVVEGRARRLRPLIRDEVYRISREALVNAFQHAEAKAIEVEIEFTARTLRVLVRDDGRGIDPEVLRAGRDGHWGLAGMRERAEGMGARLKVWSRERAGTEVELSVPGAIAFRDRPAAGLLAWWRRLAPGRERLGRLPALVWISAAGLLLAHAAAGLDPGTALTQYGHTAWRMRDGSFAGQPTAVTQTRDGFLWIGTQAGLIRFDGVRFMPWEPPKGSRLPDDRIVNLLAARDGSLWIGTARGLAQWRAPHLVVHARLGRFGALLEDRRGTIWAGHTRDRKLPPLCRFVRGDFRCFRFPDEPTLRSVTALYEDRQGELWIGGTEGVCRWRSGRPECSAIGPDQLALVHLLAADPGGTLWAGTYALGIWQLVAGRWTRHLSLPDPELEPAAIFSDRGGGFWLGTVQHGLFRWTPGRTERFTRADGLSSDAVQDLFEDREGNLWVATSTGLDRFRDVKVVTLTVQEGLRQGDVGAVVASRDGSLWIAEPGVLIQQKATGLSYYGAGEGLPGYGPTSLFEDSRGRLWVGVDNGLAWRERGRFSPLRMPDGSDVGLVQAMAEERDGSLWVATIDPRRPLVRIRDERVVEVISRRRIGAVQAGAMAADPGGGVWLGFTSGELTRYRNGRFEPHGHIRDPSRRRIWSLLPDVRGLWVVTSQGLDLLRHGNLRTLDTQNGLPCDALGDAVWGGDGALWLKATCGLVRIPAAELDAWIRQPERRVRVRVLDAFDGAQAALSPFSPRSVRSPDGRLWFAIEAGGLQVVDPGKLAGNRIPPPVEILRVVADRKDYAPAPGLRLPALTREVEIDYTALSLMIPEKVRFRYRLAGAGGGWHDAGTRRQAFFTNLKPGSYRFQVVASNNDGVWNRQGAALDFVLLPAFYQTRTFVALSVAALALLAWTAYRWRLRQVAARLDLQFQERLAERTRVAQDLHDTLLQGFLSASLQLHVAVDELPPDAPETPRLRRVQQLMAQVIDEGRNAVRGLRTPAQKLAGGDDLAEALARVPQELGLDGAAELRMIVEGRTRRLRPLIRDEVYRISREALVNAFQHAEAKAIEVEIEFTAKALRVLVRDDGRGIDPEVLRAGRDGHWGLAGMRERAEGMGAHLKVWSRERAGTEIELAVPGAIAFRDRPAAELPGWWRRLAPGRERDE